MTHLQSSTAFAPESILTTQQSGEAFLIALRSHQTASWLSKADDCLAELAKLPSNWNSYGAKSAAPQSVAVAQSLVKLLAQVVGVEEPDVGLTPDGFVTVSWVLDTSREIEVEVAPTGTMAIIHFDDECNFHQSLRTKDVGQLAELLTRWGREA